MFARYNDSMVYARAQKPGDHQGTFCENRAPAVPKWDALSKWIALD